MTKHDSTQRPGFSAVELLVVLAILSIVATLVLPNLMQLLHRSKIEGTCGRTAMLMQKARFEAIKRGVPTVVAIDPVENVVFAFADVHGVAATDPSDGLFNPIGGAVHRTTDYELGRHQLPFGVSFTSPSDSGMDSVDGFVNDGEPDPPDKQAIFLPDGTIL
ncbi:MAG: prepilin-type N-terminal cleavage/methylation domain-containing protein, partial [Thermoanaerobaculia bacterium]|nr:prepilin-type N-terminal cleavage/methylation domain-containing protein [Thermoanaerobaculia bacterium]